MGFLDSLKAWFRTEAAEAQDVGRGVKARMEADLDRREAELSASPQERFEQLQESMAANDGALDDLRAKIEGRGAMADASAEVADIDAAQRRADGGADEVLDLESEEIIPPEPPPT